MDLQLSVDELEGGPIEKEAKGQLKGKDRGNGIGSQENVIGRREPLCCTQAGRTHHCQGNRWGTQETQEATSILEAPTACPSTSAAGARASSTQNSASGESLYAQVGF